MRARSLCIAAAMAFCLDAAAADVRVWQDVLTLPTYQEGAPDPNPPFDQFAGSRFNYPYTLRESITDQRVDAAVARCLPGERVPEVLGAAGYRRAPLYVHRQDQRAAHVLRQPVDQEGADRLSRRVGGVRHRVQFPGVAQLGVDVAGGFLVREERGRQRVRLRGQYRPAVRDAVDRRAAARAGHDGARRARHAVQPQRRAASVLLVEQRGRAGVGRFEDLVPDALDAPATGSPTWTPGRSIPRAWT